MKLDSSLIAAKPSSDIEIVPGCGPASGVWEYTAKNIRDALGHICHGDQELAERLIVEAQAGVSKVRATFDGRAVGATEVNTILGPPITSAASLARTYAIRSQEANR